MAENRSRLGRLRAATDNLKRLPIIGDSLARAAKARVRASMEEIVKDPVAERRAALLGLVPKRCGLCVNFSLEAGQAFLGANAHFMMAAGVLGPDEMSKTPDMPARPIPQSALDLRPALTESWKDYGRCGLRNRILWGFEEAPSFIVEEKIETSLDEDGEEITKRTPVMGPPCGDWE